MEYERWLELEICNDLPLSAIEILDGWHWCPEWDYLLIGPGMDELDCCLCNHKWVKKAKYLTRKH